MHRIDYTVMSVCSRNYLYIIYNKTEEEHILKLELYWLVLCVNLTLAGVITEKGASVVEMPPRDLAVEHFVN